MILPLLTLLGVLWIIDLFQTLKVTGRYGPRAEFNPVARFFLKHGKREFILFKAIDFLVVSAILLFLYVDYVGIAYMLLISFILLYIYTLFHNHAVVQSLG